MRSFKKIAAMIMAVAMLCSFTALGASVSIGEIDLDGNVATIPYTATDADEVTAIVYSGETLSGANLVYIDQFEDGFIIPDIELDAYDTYTVVMGGTGVEIADTAEIYYKDTREFFTVDITSDGKGYVNYDEGLDLSSPVVKGTAINLTFAPFIGYELDTFTINGADATYNAKNNGVYTYKHIVEGNDKIAVSFKPVETAITGGVYTSGGVYDVTGEENPANPKDAEASKLAFGKAIEVPGKIAKNMGMKVEEKDESSPTGWKDFTTPAGVGPLFRATNPINNVYGIRFFGFSVGTYRVTSYVQYADAATGALEEVVYGASVEFTVG